MPLTIVLGAVAAALTAAHPPDAASRELLRSLAIVSVDSRNLSSSIQYLVRYAGSKPAETAAPLTLAQYPLAAAMSAWTKAVYCERHGCQFRLFWASPNASAFKPWFKSRIGRTLANESACRARSASILRTCALCDAPSSVFQRWS